MCVSDLGQNKREASKENIRISRPLPLPELPKCNCTYYGDGPHISHLITTTIVHTTIFSHLNCCSSPTWSIHHLSCPILYPILTDLSISVAHKAAAAAVLPGSLGELHILRSHPHLLNLNLGTILTRCPDDSHALYSFGGSALTTA